jgi:hypothetical protein
VGVIVFWPQDRSGPAGATEATKRATFVLVKGQRVGKTLVLRQVTFGDPLDTPR